MKVAICDDEEVQCELLKSYLREWSTESKVSCQIHAYPSAEAFLFEYEVIKGYQVLFLDIQMKNISGMELAKQLRALGEDVCIIFVTGNTEYVFQGYGVQALDFIVKPITKERLFEVLDKAYEKCKKEELYLLVESDGSTHKVKQREICSIESSKHDTLIHRLEGTLLCKKGISSVKEMLDEKHFYQCHRSYVVNVTCISSISKKEVITEDGKCIPIARGKWESLNKAYLDFYRGILCG